jgi:hypothetical protein
LHEFICDVAFIPLGAAALGRPAADGYPGPQRSSASEVIMKRARLLALLAILSFPREALAIQEGARRQVLVAGAPAGIFTVFFTVNVPLPNGACLYDVDWESPYSPAGSVMCEVAEQKVLGHTSCLANRSTNFTTTLISTQNPTRTCLGFDQYGLFQPVTLILGESQFTPTLNGLGVFQLFPFLPRSINIT